MTRFKDQYKNPHIIGALDPATNPFDGLEELMLGTPSSIVGENMCRALSEDALPEAIARTLVVPLQIEVRNPGALIEEVTRVGSDRFGDNEEFLMSDRLGSTVWWTPSLGRMNIAGTIPIIGSFDQSIADGLGDRRDRSANLEAKHLCNLENVLNLKPGENLILSGAGVDYKRIAHLYDLCQKNGGQLVCHDIPYTTVRAARGSIPEDVPYFTVPSSVPFLGAVMSASNVQATLALGNVLSKCSLDEAYATIESARAGGVERIIATQSVSLSPNSSMYPPNWVPDFSSGNFQVNLLNYMQSNLLRGAIPVGVIPYLDQFMMLVGAQAQYTIEQLMLDCMVHGLCRFAGEAGYEHQRLYRLSEYEDLERSVAEAQLEASVRLGSLVRNPRVNVIKYGYEGLWTSYNANLPKNTVRIFDRRLVVELSNTETSRPFDKEDPRYREIERGKSVVAAEAKEFDSHYLRAASLMHDGITSKEIELARDLAKRFAVLYIYRGLAQIPGQEMLRSLLTPELAKQHWAEFSG